MENVSTENIYLYLRSRSKILDEEIKTRNSSLIQSEPKKIIENKKNPKKINIFPIENTNWFYSSFSTYINNNFIEYPIIIEEERWIQSELNKNVPMELRNLIYKLEQEINYEKYDNIIKSDIVLKGESKFWIFLHFDKRINDKTVVIILSKEAYSNRCFVSLGSFIDKKTNNNLNKTNNSLYNINNIEKNILYESNADLSRLMSISSNGFHNFDNNVDNNIDNNIDYNSDNSIFMYNNDEKKEYDFIILKTQELIEDESLEEKKKKLKKNNSLRNNTYLNICNLNIYLFDDGRNIKLKIKLNDGKYVNEISGNCFRSAFDIKYNNLGSYKLPPYKIMIAGSGEGCTVLHFSNQLINKLQFMRYDKRGNDCECCIIN